MAKAPPFESEVALCDAFLRCVDKRVWCPYPETAGWDILLVRRADGFQIGVQAKLRLGVDVINQAIESRGSYWATAAGPDCRAVLVPHSAKFGIIADYLGLVVIVMQSASTWSKPTFSPQLPDRADAWGSRNDWPEWAPQKRHELPEFVPDVAAGASAPVQLTEWKIGAIKLAIILEKRGYLLRSDFKYIQIDHRRWLTTGWLVNDSSGWVPTKAMPDFKKQHPRNYGEIAALYDRWKPPADLLVPAVSRGQTGTSP